MLPKEEFLGGKDYWNLFDSLGEYIKTEDKYNKLVTLNDICKILLEHMGINCFLFKVIYENPPTDNVIGRCEVSGLINITIKLYNLSLEKNSIIALLIHELSHAYQLVSNFPLNSFVSTEMEMFTDYLTLYLGFFEKVQLGYMAYETDNPTYRMNYLK